MKNAIILLLISFFYFSTRHHASAQEDIIEIDLTKSIETDLPMSRIFEEVEYVRLETAENCRLKNASLYVTSEYIIAANTFRGVFVFDRKTGKFLHEVASPSQYAYSMGTFFFDEKKNLYPFWNMDHWKIFNVKTNQEEYLIRNPLHAKRQTPLLTSPVFLNDSILAIHIDNESGIEPYKLLLFNRNGVIKRAYPNHLLYEVFGQNTTPTHAFYRYGGHLFFKESEYNDTVFRVTENQLIPHIIFKLGNKKPSFPTESRFLKSAQSEKQGGFTIASSPNGGWNVKVDFETDHYVFLSAYVKEGFAASGYFLAYYDKKEHRTYRTKLVSNDKIKEKGYINDVDLLPNFCPVTKNEEDEIAGCIEAQVLLEYMTKHEKQKKRDKIKNLSDIRINDNPIIVIAKLKR